MSSTTPRPTDAASDPRPAPRLVLVMGVSGSGKTTIGQALAQALAARFVDADDYHPASNIAKMRAGIPLDDQDRKPWLERLNALLRHSAARGEPVVLACSALRVRYREQLAQRVPSLSVVHLKGDFEMIAARLAARQRHYMPPSLLRSQFDTLEPPREAIEVDIAADSHSIVRQLVKSLGG
jgi:gluconokinase